MFMRQNRRTNGAVQPETTAASDASSQRAAQKLSPNDYNGLVGQDWRFTPAMGTCAAINEAHYQGGLSGEGPYHTSYEDAIPFVGTEPPSSPDRKLKSR